MPAFCREVERGEAIQGFGIDSGTVAQEGLDGFGFACSGRVVQGGVIVLVGGIDLGSFGDEGGHEGGVAFLGGEVECGFACIASGFYISGCSE